MPFEEDQAFKLIQGEQRPPSLSEIGGRRTAATAPITIDENRKTADQPLTIDYEHDVDKPLAITDGGLSEAMNDAQPMKALLPPSGVQQRRPPATAGAKVRPSKMRKQHNSLNLRVPVTSGSQKRLKAEEMHN